MYNPIPNETTLIEEIAALNIPEELKDHLLEKLDKEYTKREDAKEMCESVKTMTTTEIWRKRLCIKSLVRSVHDLSEVLDRMDAMLPDE